MAKIKQSELDLVHPAGTAKEYVRGYATKVVVLCDHAGYWILGRAPISSFHAKLS